MMLFFLVFITFVILFLLVFCFNFNIFSFFVTTDNLLNQIADLQLNKEKLESLKVETDIETIYHFDVYRLQGPIDFIDSVGTEYFDNGLCIIEWGEIIKEILPLNTIYINIERVENEDNYRKISITKNV